ncbi:hypothetical protein [Actinoplanes sp. NPDC051859]|uniref:hypothetical protein n=1 Tax=Actinoplanes sp. NPDC051859 TaxID=3363909 RepID=UPI003792B041
MDLGRMTTVDEQLARDVARYDPARLRRLTAAIVRHGLDQAPVADPRLTAGLTQLDAGPWGDTAIRADLQGLVDELDEIAWDAQEAAEEGDGDEAEYDVTFARARAAHALFFALDADPVRAALESAYEVQAGLGDFPAVEAILRGA